MKLNEIRKKQLKIIGVGLAVIFIVYFVYPTINTFRLKLTSKNIKPTEGAESNVFENISYIGVDASGKQYNVRAKLATIDSKTKKRRTSQIKADKVIIDTFKKTVEVVMEEKGKQVTGTLSNE